jgi:hypothetical protein
MKPTTFALSFVVFAAIGLTGCKKGPALEEVKKIEEACNAKDKEKAIDIALKAAESNSSFKKAFDGVFESVEDKKKANVCGGINLAELKTRIENGPAI